MNSGNEKEAISLACERVQNMACLFDQADIPEQKQEIIERLKRLYDDTSDLNRDHLVEAFRAARFGYTMSEDFADSVQIVLDLAEDDLGAFDNKELVMLTRAIVLRCGGISPA